MVFFFSDVPKLFFTHEGKENLLTPIACSWALDPRRGGWSRKKTQSHKNKKSSATASTPNLFQVMHSMEQKLKNLFPEPGKLLFFTFFRSMLQECCRWWLAIKKRKGFLLIA